MYNQFTLARIHIMKDAICGDHDEVAGSRGETENTDVLTLPFLNLAKQNLATNTSCETQR